MYRFSMASMSITRHRRAFLLYLGALSALFFAIGLGLLARNPADDEPYSTGGFLLVGLCLAFVLVATIWTVVLLILGTQKKELRLSWYVGIDLWMWLAIHGCCISGMLFADPSGYVTEVYHSVAYQVVAYLAYALACIQGAAHFVFFVIAARKLDVQNKTLKKALRATSETTLAPDAELESQGMNGKL